MMTCDVCGHVNPDGLQYCENCGVELKKSTPVTPAAPASGVPYASDPATGVSSAPSSAPATADVATADVLESATQTPVESLGDKVAAMVEEPVRAAVPAAIESSVVQEPLTDAMDSSTNTTPSEATVSTPLEMPPLEAPAVETPPLVTPPLEPAVVEPEVVKEAMSEAAATGTLSSVQSEPILAQDVHSIPRPSSVSGEMPDAPVSSATLEQAPEPAQTPIIAVPLDMSSPTSGSSTPGTPTPAKLGVKKFGALTGETLPLMGTNLVVGRFDPSTGPVELDVSSLPGAEHISRRHAEIYFEDGVWKVRDLGSTNGVFVKKAAEASFSPRLQTPMNLGAGDEIAFGNMVLVFLVD
jgi:hypothetical protein